MRSVLAGLILLLGATASGSADEGDVMTPEDPAEVLREADRAFCRDTQAEGAAGWSSWFAEDGVQFPPVGRVDGREAIGALMTPVFAPGQPRLLWDPVEAVLAGSGDLGWTLGRWRMLAADSDSLLGEGNYVTLWRKIDGDWRVAVDIGNSDPEEGS
jgi:ketosteroid isomerase-like protein